MRGGPTYKIKCLKNSLEKISVDVDLFDSLKNTSIKNYDLQIIIAIVCAALIATIVPAIQIYKNTLRDGLSVKS